MPRDSFAFAVFIGGEPDGFGVFGGAFKLGNDFGVPRVDFVGNVKGGFVNFGVFANVPNRGEDMKILTKVFFDSMSLCRRLHDD